MMRSDTATTILRRSFDQSQARRLHPNLLIGRIYAARGVSSADQVDYSLSNLYRFDRLKDIDKAVYRLDKALSNQETVLIVGDFDADGATGTALAVKALRAMGFEQVDYLVPNRFEYGYGLSKDLVSVIAELDPRPKLVITVDNGITSFEGVMACVEMGIDVIITDHHLAGETLPKAHAVLNPNQPEDEFASKCLAGVGVIFYLMVALRAHLQSVGWFDQRGLSLPRLSDYLDLVAIGTISDVVKLDYNNRILVAQGLKRIRNRQGSVGVQALFSMAGREVSTVTASDIGFFIGPLLNAAGRLKDMRLGIDCLLSDRLPEALGMSQGLAQLNTQRKQIEQMMYQQALTEISQQRSKLRQLPLAFCLFQEHWHQGVSGILAGRLKADFNRPVAIFARSTQTLLKASVRSIENLNIREVLASIAQSHPSVLKQYGGHAQAAGLSLVAEDYEVFKGLFLEAVERFLKDGMPTKLLMTDGVLKSNELSVDLVDQIRSSGPWGQAFPAPTFDGAFVVLDQKIVGEKHLKLKLRPAQVQSTQKNCIDAIQFNTDLGIWPNPDCQQIRMVYRLDINEYLGKRSLQCIVQHIVPMLDPEA